MDKFRDKVVVITGAGEGIGRAIALAFAKNGAKLYLTDIDSDRLSAIVERIKNEGGIAAGFLVDSSKSSEVEKLADDVYADAGRVDILVNNAGIGVGGDIEKIDLKSWEKIIAVNLWGVIYGVHFFLPRMIAQGGGHIVNTASGLGLLGSAGVAPYVTTKFGVVGLSESMNMELHKFGIYTTALCPGLISTNIARDGDIGGSDEKAPELHSAATDFWDRFGVPPERVAADLLRGIARRKPLVLTPASHVWPLWIVKRISVRGFQALGRFFMGQVNKKLGRE